MCKHHLVLPPVYVVFKMPQVGIQDNFIFNDKAFMN